MPDALATALTVLVWIGAYLLLAIPAACAVGRRLARAGQPEERR